MNKFKVRDKVRLARPPEEDPYFAPGMESTVSFDKIYIVSYVCKNSISIEESGKIIIYCWHPDTFKKVDEIFVKLMKTMRY